MAYLLLNEMSDVEEGQIKKSLYCVHILTQRPERELHARVNAAKHSSFI